MKRSNAIIHLSSEEINKKTIVASLLKRIDRIFKTKLFMETEIKSRQVVHFSRMFLEKKFFILKKRNFLNVI